MHGWFSRKRLCTSANAFTIELAAITTSDPLDDLFEHTGTVVVVCLFIEVDGKPTRGRLVLVNGVTTSTVVGVATIDVVELVDEEEPQDVMPISKRGNNGRRRTL